MALTGGLKIYNSEMNWDGFIVSPKILVAGLCFRSWVYSSSPDSNRTEDTHWVSFKVFCLNSVCCSTVISLNSYLSVPDET